MPPKTTLNAKNLEALGAVRLAELLIEISTGDAGAKRRLRLELAGAESPAEAARAVTKRLTAIARAQTQIDWQKRRAFVEDLESQRRAIAGPIATADPKTALDLLWRFLGLAGPVFDRCDDSTGTVMGVFEAALADLGRLVAVARIDPSQLADRVFEALKTNNHGQYDGLIETVAPTLGPVGLAQLKQRVTAFDAEPGSRVKDPPAAGGASWRLMSPQVAEARWRQSVVATALKQIADALGDVDAYVAQHPEAARAMPRVAAEIADRLLKAGRAQEALAALDRVDRDRIDPRWEETRIATLEVLGRSAEAQAFRWASFERTLNPERLRAHLKRLPDFEDIEAEERALAWVATHPDVTQALHFLVSWPALDRAAALVRSRIEEIDGDRYEVLTPAADTLADRHPLAATILRRKQIDFALEKSRASRYGHAAGHLNDCAALAPLIADFGPIPPHEAYVASLKAHYGRRSGFWRLVT